MIATEDDVLQQAQAWREAERRVAIATVIETWGAAPRPAGSHLVIDGDGTFIGSICGGCVEGAVAAASAEVLASGAPRMLEIAVTDGTAWAAGLSCGGRIRIYLERLD